MKTIKELEAVEAMGAIHPRRRMVVMQRDDGHFTFAVEYYYISQYEGEIVSKGWRQLPPNGIYATAAIAEAEGRASLARWR